MTELLVVMVIVGVLAVLAVQVVRRSSEQSKKIGCVSNLRQIGVALLAYAADNRQELPLQATGEPHFTPIVLTKELVGRKGVAGYLPWNGDNSTPEWTDVMLCPGDPNRAIYAARPVDNIPSSYMYRQNAQAGRGTETNPSIRLSLLTRPENQEGYQRWIIADRHVHGPVGIEKPYEGKEMQLRGNGAPAWWYSRDTISKQSYWHPEGTNVLYEDGSVAFRKFGTEPLGR